MLLRTVLVRLPSISSLLSCYHNGIFLNDILPKRKCQYHLHLLSRYHYGTIDVKREVFMSTTTKKNPVVDVTAPNDPTTSLGFRLFLLRDLKKLTQTKLCDDLGISKVNYSRYEKDLRSPDYDTLLKFATYFNVTTDFLLGKIKEPQLSCDLMEDFDYRFDINKILDLCEDLTDDELKQVIRYIKFMISERPHNDDDNL